MRGMCQSPNRALERKIPKTPREGGRDLILFSQIGDNSAFLTIWQKELLFTQK